MGRKPEDRKYKVGENFKRYCHLEVAKPSKPFQF